MSTGAWVLIGIGLLLLLIAVTKPTREMVGGWHMRDRKGRIVLVLSPTRRKRRRR